MSEDESRSGNDRMYEYLFECTSDEDLIEDNETDIMLYALNNRMILLHRRVWFFACFDEYRELTQLIRNDKQLKINADKFFKKCHDLIDDIYLCAGKDEISKEY